LSKYTVIAFDMKRRTREFGVGIAIGASPQHIFVPVLRQELALTVIGLMVGFALSFAAGTLMRSARLGVTPTDTVTYSGVFLLLTAASIVAHYLPARRASSVDPITALRSE
jgi:ABC-type antimicrobial peptide transport system permease subunit